MRHILLQKQREAFAVQLRAQLYEADAAALWGRGNDPDAKLLALVTQWDTCPAAPAVKVTRLLKCTWNRRLASLFAATLLCARYAKCYWMLFF